MNKSIISNIPQALPHNSYRRSVVTVNSSSFVVLVFSEILLKQKRFIIIVLLKW